MNWINTLINDYHAFLKEKTHLKADATTGWVEISTPFLNMFNDSVELYAKQESSKIVLSDDGQTLRNLDLSGVGFSHSPKRKEFLQQILLNYGVKLEGGELRVEATEGNFPQRKLNLLSAIAEANDLYALSKHTVASVFKEDVKGYLDEQDLIYTPYFLSKGSTGIEFSFDFQIAYRQSEIVIKSFNTINKMNLPQFLFTWEDVRKVREQQTGKAVVGMAIVNDIEREVKGEYLEALASKGASYILWSERHKAENLSKLRAVA